MATKALQNQCPVELFTGKNSVLFVTIVTIKDLNRIKGMRGYEV